MMEENSQERRHGIYTAIRNEHNISNYGIQKDLIVKKHKYKKTYNTKEYILNYIKNNPDCGWVAFDEYFITGLMPVESYKYVDEYIKIIPKFCIRTDKIIPNIYVSTGLFGHDYLYSKVWYLNPDPELEKKYPEFWHNGCFYLAMIYLGYEYKRHRNGVVDWNMKLI